MKTLIQVHKQRTENACQHRQSGHNVTHNVTDEDVGGEVYRLRLKNDRLLCEVRALRLQRDKLLEANRQLKEQLDAARQMQFSTYGNCRECGTPLPPKEDTGRDRVYCTPACKMRAYRKRKKRDET